MPNKALVVNRRGGIVSLFFHGLFALGFVGVALSGGATAIAFVGELKTGDVTMHVYDSPPSLRQVSTAWVPPILRRVPGG